jgi:hypothetical protein
VALGAPVGVLVGRIVGFQVEGPIVGDVVGLAVGAMGAWVFVGRYVTGAPVGRCVGLTVAASTRCVSITHPKTYHNNIHRIIRELSNTDTLSVGIYKLLLTITNISYSINGAEYGRYIRPISFQNSLISVCVRCVCVCV